MKDNFNYNLDATLCFLGNAGLCGVMFFLIYKGMSPWWLILCPGLMHFSSEISKERDLEKKKLGLDDD